MFTENHVTTLCARYIPIAFEIASATQPADITQRSWGSAVLAATYRALCNACQLVTSSAAILGCPILLQLWSWERFPIGRPDVRVEEPYPVQLDVDRIDMPTFGFLWTRRKVRLIYIVMKFVTFPFTCTNYCFVQRRFAHDQLKNCYEAFNELFDTLSAEAVIWEPYTDEQRMAKYPGGISDLCTRDRAYWMTKSKIVFDIYVEEMSQQRVMRQFGLRQLALPLSAEEHVPPTVHRCV